MAGALSAEAAKLTGLKAGTPITLGYVDVICTGLGGGLFDPLGKTGCTIVGSTGMHMRVAPTAADVKLNAEMSGYTMCFPVPGMYAQMQSNMASTLNIDWLLDMARDMLKNEGVERITRRFAERHGRKDHGAACRSHFVSSLYQPCRRTRPLHGAGGARHVYGP